MRYRCNPKGAVGAAIIVVGALSSTAATASAGFPNSIPNGLVYSCNTCHVDTPRAFDEDQVTDTHNVFGEDVWATLNNGTPDWAVLCPMDSDGDEQTNGLELGDPACVWSPGAEPARLTDISRPNDPEIVTSADDGGSTEGAGEGDQDGASGDGGAGDDDGGGNDGGGGAGGGDGCHNSAPGGAAALISVLWIARRGRRLAM